MSKIEKIIDQLKELSLLEASELVTAIEETFGVSASAPVAMAAPAGGGAAPAEAAAEKTEFKNILNIGLAEAKAKVESVPFVLVENANKEDANKFKDLLSGAGATVTLD
jgi:large subunit ribosomal protein L7/L12